VASVGKEQIRAGFKWGDLGRKKRQEDPDVDCEVKLKLNLTLMLLT